MSDDERAPARSLKERALEEFRVYWVITLYLWLFLASFTAYRRLILAEIGFAHVPYGIALVEALVIAKVVLLGRIFGFSRRFEDQRLIVPVIYKSIVFGLLVVVFSVVEHLVTGWIHGRGALDGLREIASVGAYEIAARLLALTVAFVPFFAFYELGRVLGMRKLAGLFFARPAAADADPARPA
jgi:hypothetical protein